MTTHIARLYEGGMTLDEIAAETSTSRSTVRRRLIAAGVRLRRPCRRPGAHALRDAGIAAEYHAGVRICDLARRHHLTRCRVWQVLRAAAGRPVLRRKGSVDHM